MALHNALEQAQALMEKGNYKEASSLLEDFGKKQNTRHYLLDFITGNAWLGQENPEKAKTYYLACIEKKPDFLPAHQNLARCYFELNDMALASASYEKAYTLSNPKEPDLLFYAAICLSVGKDYAGSLALFDKLMAAHKNEARLEWKEAMVQTMLEAGKNRDALPLLEEIAQQSTGNKKRQWQEVLLYQYDELGMKKKALSYVNNLLDESPAEPLWWKSLWRLHLNQGHYKEGLAALIAYSYFQPLSPDEVELAGDLYAASGVPSKAADFYQQSLKNAQKPEVVLKLVNNLRRMGKPEQALEWIDRALANGPKKEFLLPRAYVLYDMKDYQNAAKAFEAAAPEAGKPGQAWLMAGYAAYNEQNMKAARIYLKNAARFKYSQNAASRLLVQIQNMEDS